MRQYRDVPMDFADSTLVAVCERRGENEMVTLDPRGFSVYRLPNRRSFRILP